MQTFKLKTLDLLNSGIIQKWLRKNMNLGLLQIPKSAILMEELKI